MQITHAEAQKLIQFNADNVLNDQEHASLAAHLQNCSECRRYAEEIREVESVLVPVMQRHWNLQPAPLQIHALYQKRSLTIQRSLILATRTVAVGAIFLAFLFSVRQFALQGGQNSSPLTVGVPPIPTPSAPLTSTTVRFQNCESILYEVQENDTLAFIAYRFGVPEEDIRAANRMPTDTVFTGVKILIPICPSTPTRTSQPTTRVTTYTPSVSPKAFTPDG
jgi:hypothetical protein